MQVSAIYRHRLRTARRFVFENILDLEHVCALHHRWFRNLRVRVRRPDYVEYRLTSIFYGLRQEIVARGAPIDANRYWYEFDGRLASIRVEGLLEGADGDLMQTETITYRFPRFLAPLFWLLRPLFRRQKNDILHDDTVLLERVYELEQNGFQRTEHHSAVILVYGGGGFFGKLLVEDLLANSSAHIVVAGRRPNATTFAAHTGRVSFYESDLNDYASVSATLAGARPDVAIDASGPFQGHPTTLLLGCIQHRVHYIDLADDRDFVVRAFQLKSEIESAGIAALIGCSVVPGISSLLLEHAREQLGSVCEARIFISPGTRNPRGPGSFHCLLSTVGVPYTIPTETGSKTVDGWSRREAVEFPPPLGKRYAYYVVDVADYFVQPLLYGVAAVHFKIASELDFLNRMLSVLRWLKRRLKLRSLDWSLPISRLIIRLAATFGTSNGGLLVQAKGATGACLSVAILAAEQGERIPAMLPAIAAEQLIAGSLTSRGIVLSPQWLSFSGLLIELERRGVQVQERVAGKAWQPISIETAASGTLRA